MSEINCFGDEIIYGHVVPGWSLVRLININVTPNEYKVNGDLMGEGHIGLTRLKGSIVEGHSLIAACLKVNPRFSSPHIFLIDRMAEVIKEGPIKEYRR